MKTGWRKQIEKLVPPVELCMELPTNELQDTAFVWYYPDNEGCHWELLPREEAGPEPKVPAPLWDELVLADRVKVTPLIQDAVDAWMLSSGHLQSMSHALLDVWVRSKGETHEN